MALKTTDMLKGIARNLPGTDSEAEKRRRAAQAIQLRQATAQMTPGANIKQAAQAAGAAMPAVAPSGPSQAAVGLAQQAIQASKQETAQAEAGKQLSRESQLFSAGEAAKEGQHRGEMAQRKQLSKAEEDTKNRLSQAGINYDNQLAFMSRKQREDLAALGLNVKSELFDSRLAFDQDELGRKFDNERQLADWVVSSTLSQDEQADRMQEMVQSSDRMIQILESSHAMVVQKLEQERAKSKQEQDQDLLATLTKMESDAKATIQRKKDQAENVKQIVKVATLVAGV
jgi:hypothetical protein